MSRPNIRSFIEEENKKHQVVVWAKSYCPYCAKTKALFQTLVDEKVITDYVVHDLDLDPDGTQIQEELLAITEQRTVPNVFVKNQHIGGNDATQVFHKEGKLIELLSSD